MSAVVRDQNDRDENDGGDKAPGAVRPSAGPTTDPSPPSRAGRNLPVAIAVGVALGAVVIGALFVRKEVFVGLTALGVAGALVELRRALATRDLRIALLPLLAGSVATLVAAYVAGAEALIIGVAATCAATVMWQRLDPGSPRSATARMHDAGAAVLAVLWLPLLAGFAVLLLAHADGAQRVVVFVLVPVCSDVGGYTAGVLFGRHPLAPTVSPKKSWEGLGGSAVACLLGGTLSVTLLLGGSWWAGVLVGVSAVVTATLGDLSESILKRDLGLKDMGSLLPGHGGVLDRLDSLLATAPVVWLLLTLLVPVR